MFTDCLRDLEHSHLQGFSEIRFLLQKGHLLVEICLNTSLPLEEREAALADYRDELQKEEKSLADPVKNPDDATPQRRERLSAIRRMKRELKKAPALLAGNIAQEHSEPIRESDWLLRDFFISYNNEHDRDSAAWIAYTLQKGGYTTYFQEEDCKPGKDFLKWMEKSIAHSMGFLAILSSAYEKSDYCTKELHAAMVRQHRGNYLLLPVRVEDAPVTNPLLGPIIRVDLLSSDEAENRAALLQAAEQIRKF